MATARSAPTFCRVTRPTFHDSKIFDILYGLQRTVAQLVEHDTFNVGVAGPIPASPTNPITNKKPQLLTNR